LAIVGFFSGASASRAVESLSRVQIVTAPGISRVAKAQADAAGTIHLLFDSERGPRYANSHDGGVTFGAPIEIVDAAARRPGLSFTIEDLAVAPDGRVHVALSSNAWKLKLPEDEWCLHYATLAPGGKTFSPLHNLNHRSSESFSLAATNGTVTAAFLSGKLYTMVSHNDGETFSAATEPNPAWNPCDCCTTAMTYGADGRLALLYREETNNDRDLHLILADQRGAHPPTRTRVSTTPWKIEGCPMTKFTVAATPDGYAAAWPTKGEVYFARLDRDGALLPPGEIKTPGKATMHMGVTALAASDGSVVVAWKDKETLGWQLYDARGAAVGSPTYAPSPGNGAAGVVRRDGKFLLFP